MEIRLITVGRRATRKNVAIESLFAGYCERIHHHCPCRADNFPTEGKLLAALERTVSRTRPMMVMLDSRGRTWSTEIFAQWLARERERGTQQVVFAIGPPNGWSDAARSRAGLVLSFGPMTLPQELATVVLAEQIYRAFTILEGHPYHLGHSNK